MLTRITIEDIPENDSDKEWARKVETTSSYVTIDKFIYNFSTLLLSYGFSEKLVKDYIKYEDLF